jgi:hypothetical protein
MITWNVGLILSLLVPFGGAVVLFLLLPQLSRPDLFFAVTVAPEVATGRDARRILARYRRTIAVAGILGGVAVGVGAGLELVPVLVAGMVTPGIAAVVAFQIGRRAVLPLAVAPSAVREATLAPRPGLPGGAAGQLAPFAMLLASAIALWLLGDRLPAEIPVHWNLRGEPDRFAAPTSLALFAPHLVGAVVCGFMALIAYGIEHHSAARDARIRRANLQLLLGAELLVALTIATIAFLPFLPAPQAAVALLLAIGPGFMAVVLIVVLRLGLNRSAPVGDDGRPVGDRTPDAAWRGGIFYVNRADPALFVEKRFGFGYTVNFGHPLAWVVVAAIVAVVVVSVVLAAVSGA